MWETTDIGDESLLWATTNFFGGIAGDREGTCGALSGAAVFLGLRHRTPPDSKEDADLARKTVREKTRALVDSFRATQGHILCSGLIGVDVSDAAAMQIHRESGEWMKRCTGLVHDVVRRLYEMEVA